MGVVGGTQLLIGELADAEARRARCACGVGGGCDVARADKVDQIYELNAVTYKEMTEGDVLMEVVVQVRSRSPRLLPLPGGPSLPRTLRRGAAGAYSCGRAAVG